MTIEETFRKRLGEERKRRGWSQAELSRRVTALGHKLDKDAMSKIENGPRRVTLEDAVALAAALDAPLPALLLGHEGEELSPVPTITLRTPFAADWLMGETPLARENLSTYEQVFRRVSRLEDILPRLLLRDPNAHEIEMTRAHVELRRQRAAELDETASRSDIPAPLSAELRGLAEMHRAKATEIDKLLPKEKK